MSANVFGLGEGTNSVGFERLPSHFAKLLVVRCFFVLTKFFNQ